MKLVLLPGMDGTGLLFRPLLDLLDRTDLSVLVIDYPIDQSLTYTELLPLVRNRLPANEDFILLAESYSGPLALQLIAEEINGHTGTVLVATFVRNPRPLLLRFLPHKLIGLLLHLPIPDFMLRYFLLGPDATTALSALCRQAIRRVKPQVLAARLADISACHPPISNHTHPCLCLIAAQDKLVPAHCSDDLRNTSRRVQLTHLPGPHALLQSQPEACLSAILAHLAWLTGQ
ncbi:MAG: alpha/beta hydrolase [Gammaproteobacteria bacterium]|nr:alpha/beta hydrolase [Gammaproteobacteria bacterium]MDH5653504.1 alpha/beta hydrolase [Gammaproteobacteria bacterium]